MIIHLSNQQVRRWTHSITIMVHSLLYNLDAADTLCVLETGLQQVKSLHDV